MRLFNPDNTVNDKALEPIQQTLYPANTSSIEISNLKMNSTQLALFFKLVQKCPYSEQQFFVTPAKKPRKEPTVREVINNSARLNLFSLFQRLNYRLSYHQMDASVGMWEAAMEVCFSEPVMPQIVIGASPAEDFFPTNTGILSIAYPGIQQPTQADGHPALGTDFYYHDWYHIDFVSHIPETERKRMNNIVLAVHKQMDITQEPLHRELLNILYNTLLDREFTIYKQNIILETAIEDGKVMQDFDLESLPTEGGTFPNGEGPLCRKGFWIKRLHQFAIFNCRF